MGNAASDEGMSPDEWLMTAESHDRIAHAHGLAQARATLGWVENVRPQLEREARRRRRSGTRG